MYKHVRLWTSSPAQSGPLAPRIHFLTLRLHQDIHSTYTVKITRSALRVVSETRKELLLCWLIALSRYFLPAPAVWLHALPRASASSSEKKMSCRSLPTIEWKQAFDQRPRRAGKGTNGFRRTRRGGTCHEVWNAAPTTSIEVDVCSEYIQHTCSFSEVSYSHWWDFYLRTKKQPESSASRNDTNYQWKKKINRSLSWPVSAPDIQPNFPLLIFSPFIPR